MGGCQERVEALLKLLKEETANMGSLPELQRQFRDGENGPPGETAKAKADGPGTNASGVRGLGNQD